MHNPVEPSRQAIAGLPPAPHVRARQKRPAVPQHSRLKGIVYTMAFRQAVHLFHRQHFTRRVPRVGSVHQRPEGKTKAVEIGSNVARIRVARVPASSPTAGLVASCSASRGKAAFPQRPTHIPYAGLGRTLETPKRATRRMTGSIDPSSFASWFPCCPQGDRLFQSHPRRPCDGYATS